MGDAPRYEENPSPRFLAVLRAVVPGFEPTADGWFAVERELKRRLQIRDRPGFAALRADFLQEWTEADVLRVLDPTISPFQTGGAVAGGDFHESPSFPARPLDPCCLASAELSSADKVEIVSLVRKVQTDFDPEADARGWDSVAVLVRGVGYGAEEVRQMDYPQLAAIFRTSGAQMRLQKTGSVACGIATSTSTIVRLDDSAAPPPPPSDGSRVLRFGASKETDGQRIVLGRADLTRRLQDDWATPDGKRFLLGSTVRVIATHYGLEAHSSLYSNNFWKTVIKPARKTTGFRAKAIDWVDSLSRDRR
jgi:hypothetical protein